MKRETDPRETLRAEAFRLWMTSPMPMVTLTKTLDVTRLRRVARRRGMKFNALLCWCIGKAASGNPLFYLLPEEGGLWQYDSLAVNVIVNNCRGGINSCDIPFGTDLGQFCRDYDRLTAEAAARCESSFMGERMIIGTSAMTDTELDSVVNQYTDRFANPLAAWGRYRRGLFRVMLPLSFQFHHVQMDGGDAARFLELLQKTIRQL